MASANGRGRGRKMTKAQSRAKPAVERIHDAKRSVRIDHGGHEHGLKFRHMLSQFAFFNAMPKLHQDATVGGGVQFAVEQLAGSRKRQAEALDDVKERIIEAIATCLAASDPANPMTHRKCTAKVLKLLQGVNSEVLA